MRPIPFLILGLSVFGCTDETGVFSSGPVEDRIGSCSLNVAGLHDTGVPRDGIPALSDPELVPANDGRAEYILGHQRVIGIEVTGQYIAVPHNILWWHEIVNFNALGTPLAVTYCPLTGSSLVFDRNPAGGAELGVSGLLLDNNLIMYDRAPNGTDVSFWSQMLGEAKCGPQSGVALARYPAVEMTWDGWRSLHPDTRVIGEDTGYSRDYRRYPYGGYEALDNPETLYPQGDHDIRRQPKERVLGIPGENGGGIAFPFLALGRPGIRSVVHEISGGEPVVVFWDGVADGAVAFRPTVQGQQLTFAVEGGRYVDRQTGSEWALDGEAVSGDLVGERLPKVSEAYVAFWFAWARFFPNTTLWLP
ncbi:MAG: DUF3179 domain-containing protein [Gemmatimonadetes bacterium]|nr:DUF3179 domain-containing protein [Gemmatimonadota bacterium]NNM03989.1 DUF3179 domain-containing protein [Gemmatimonadota bacterium]